MNVIENHRAKESGELGGTLIEFTVVASVFLMMLIGICAGANLYFTHNALVEATRRGARFAATQAASTPAGVPTTGQSGCASCLTDIQNYTIYGNTAGTGSNLLNLQPANVSVEYASFGVGAGTVSASITGYNYNFVIPGINKTITMPPYRSTAAGESAGTAP